MNKVKVWLADVLNFSWCYYSSNSPMVCCQCWRTLLDLNLSYIKLTDAMNILFLWNNIVLSVSFLYMQDYDGNGTLSYAEFSDLIDAFGNQLAATKVCIWIIIWFLIPLVSLFVAEFWCTMQRPYPIWDGHLFNTVFVCSNLVSFIYKETPPASFDTE